MKKSVLLAGLLLSVPAFAGNQLTLYFIPSPYGIDWSSPANLAWSALKNRLSFQSNFMGHVYVELECGEKKELTGMVGKNSDYLNQILMNGRGLGILYHSFDGHLETKAEVEENLAKLSKTGERLNFVRFNLNKDQCSRGLSYLSEYREKNVGRYYGLANRPLYAEGAGCSAFGASFTEVTGVLTPDLQDAWSESVDIPLTYAGPPLRDEKVNIFKVMFNAQHWATPNEPQQKIVFWSPDMMHTWVKEKLAKAKEEKTFTVSQFGNAKGIVFEKSHLPAPSGPIWQQHLDRSLSRSKKE